MEPKLDYNPPVPEDTGRRLPRLREDAAREYARWYMRQGYRGDDNILIVDENDSVIRKTTINEAAGEGFDPRAQTQQEVFRV